MYDCMYETMHECKWVARKLEDLDEIGGLIAFHAVEHPRDHKRHACFGVCDQTQGAGCRVQDSGRRVQGAGFRVQGSGFRVQGSGSRI